MGSVLACRQSSFGGRIADARTLGHNNMLPYLFKHSTKQSNRMREIFNDDWSHERRSRARCCEGPLSIMRVTVQGERFVVAMRTGIWLRATQRATAGCESVVLLS